MKIRNGFVSNSSSSSFIILLDTITEEQLFMLYDHIGIGKEIDDNLVKEGKEKYYRYYEEWVIKTDGFSVWCSTSMDNFDLKHLAEEVIGIDQQNIIDIGDDAYFYDLYKDPDYINIKRNKILNHLKNIIKK